MHFDIVNDIKLFCDTLFVILYVLMFWTFDPFLK